MSDQEPKSRYGLSIDFSVNIPRLLVIVSTIVSLTAGWVHLSDSLTAMASAVNQQTNISAKLAQHLDRMDTKLIILDQRLRLYPLHRHVGSQIIVDDSKGLLSSEPQEKQKDP